MPTFKDILSKQVSAPAVIPIAARGACGQVASLSRADKPRFISSVSTSSAKPSLPHRVVSSRYLKNLTASKSPSNPSRTVMQTHGKGAFEQMKHIRQGLRGAHTLEKHEVAAMQESISGVAEYGTSKDIAEVAGRLVRTDLCVEGFQECLQIFLDHSAVDKVLSSNDGKAIYATTKALSYLATTQAQYFYAKNLNSYIDPNIVGAYNMVLKQPDSSSFSGFLSNLSELCQSQQLSKHLAQPDIMATTLRRLLSSQQAMTCVTLTRDLNGLADLLMQQLPSESLQLLAKGLDTALETIKSSRPTVKVYFAFALRNFAAFNGQDTDFQAQCQKLYQKLMPLDTQGFDASTLSQYHMAQAYFSAISSSAAVMQPTVSQVQKKVFEALRAKFGRDYLVVQEKVLPQLAVPSDIVMYSRQDMSKFLVIEVDGPQHFHRYSGERTKTTQRRDQSYTGLGYPYYVMALEGKYNDRSLIAKSLKAIQGRLQQVSRPKKKAPPHTAWLSRDQSSALSYASALAIGK